MKKYMLLIAASLVASALVTGCGAPAEGNTTTTPGAAAEGTKPEGTTPTTADAPTPAPEDKK